MDRVEKYIKEIIEKSRLKETDQFIHHGHTTILQHNTAVARKAFWISQKLKWRVSEKEMIFGAMLHDYYFYDWHVKDKSHRLHGYFHPENSLRNAMKDMELTIVEQDIIRKHMFPLTIYPPKYKESLIVCVADKLCALDETFVRKKKRMTHAKVNIDGKVN